MSYRWWRKHRYLGWPLATPGWLQKGGYTKGTGCAPEGFGTDQSSDRWLAWKSSKWNLLPRMLEQFLPYRHSMKILKISRHGILIRMESFQVNLHTTGSVIYGQANVLRNWSTSYGGLLTTVSRISLVLIIDFAQYVRGRTRMGHTFSWNVSLSSRCGENYNWSRLE